MQFQDSYESLKSSGLLLFEEQILEAAKLIVTSVGTLIKVIIRLQRELLVKRRIAKIALKLEDEAWAKELNLAAHLVVADTCLVCEAVLAILEGKENVDKTVKYAKAIAESTAELLMSCKSGGEPTQRTAKMTQCACVAVTRATDSLVQVAKGLAMFQKDFNVDDIYYLNVWIKEELQIQEDIVKKERQLESARAKLSHIREENRQHKEVERWTYW